VADGHIEQVAYSLDGMTTVDLRLVSTSFDGRSQPSAGRFLRMEIFGCARRSLRFQPEEGQRVSVRGRLMWDGDGFFEVHPVAGSDVQLFKATDTR